MANEITQTYKYLDWAGLSHFWTKVKEYIIANKSIVVDGRAGQEVVEGSDATWRPTDNKWITVASTSNTAGTTTYTVNDGNITSKFGLVENELATIKANAGVTGVKFVDDETSDLVKVTVTNSLPSGATDGVGGMKKGDITITLDESRLKAFETTTKANEKTIDDARKDDIKTLYGDDYTAADATTLGASGAVANTLSAEGAYNTITKINQRLKAIDASVVTKVTAKDVNEGEVDYIKFTSSDADGTGDIELTVDEKALDTKIAAMDGATAAEVTARKNADALLAGDSWNKDNGSWTATPTYATITELSQQVEAAESKIEALSSATHFRGVHASLEAAKTAIGDSLDYGDIIIIGPKEYIYNADPEAEGYVYDVAHWVELGDTTEEVRRIGALETWVNNPITNDEIDSLFATA